MIPGHIMSSPFAKVPFCKHVISDPNLLVKDRYVDNHWRYEKIINNYLNGFNPIYDSVFISKVSAIGDFFGNPEADFRDQNSGDFLVREFLFLCHDYLHIWCYQIIQQAVPELGFGSNEITSDNIEDMVFCHIITEVAATVGLDYWLLCAIDLDEILQCGTNVRALTVSYSESNIAEYRRFNEGFAVQDPQFFSCLATFYCTGQFSGFEKSALVRSPKIVDWLRHELLYAVTQRSYCRQWYAYLAKTSTNLYPSIEALTGQISIDHDWKRGLIDQIAKILWRGIKDGNMNFLRPPEQKHRWTSKDSIKPLDFRFVNLFAVEREIGWDGVIKRGIDRQSDYWLRAQYLSSFSFWGGSSDVRREMRKIIGLDSLSLIQKVMAHEARLDIDSDQGPWDIFLLN